MKEVRKEIPTLLKVREVAERLRISRQFCYELINSDEIKSIRVGNKTYVSEEWLLGYLDRSCAMDISNDDF